MAAATTSRENLSDALTIHLIIGLLIDGERQISYSRTLEQRTRIAQLEGNGCQPPEMGAHPSGVAAGQMAALNSLNFESMIRISYFGGCETNELITIWILARTVAAKSDIGAVATFGMYNCRLNGERRATIGS